MFVPESVQKSRISSITGSFERFFIYITTLKTTHMEQPSKDLLQEFEHTADLTPASPGLRFVNCLIDVVAWYAISFVIMIVVSLLFYASGAYEVEASETTTPVEPGVMQIILLLGGLLYFTLYYALIEYFFKGRTLGKMATGTVVVREDGAKITFKDAFLRSLCRLIPFEALSAFGYRPWHDSLTNTLVVKKNK